MQQIAIYMAPGEGTREEAMRRAMHGDGRFFELQIRSDLVVDLHCRFSGEHATNVLNIELKEPADWVSSVLSGHLYSQVLSCREDRQNACVVILGTLDEIYAAIKDASKRRKGKYLKGLELSQAIASNHLRCKSFRKRSMLNGVPVFHKGDDSGFFDGDDQWKDILDLSYDFLCDGDLLGFRARPAENDRDVCAAATLFKGIGSDSMRELLKDYDLMFCPKLGARRIEDIPGFGKKRCEMIRPRVQGNA